MLRYAHDFLTCLFSTYVTHASFFLLFLERWLINILKIALALFNTSLLELKRLCFLDSQYIHSNDLTEYYTIDIMCVCLKVLKYQIRFLGYQEVMQQLIATIETIPTVRSVLQRAA